MTTFDTSDRHETKTGSQDYLLWRRWQGWQCGGGWSRTPASWWGSGGSSRYWPASAPWGREAAACSHGAPPLSACPRGSALCHLLPSALLNFLSITGTRCHFRSHPQSTNSLLLSNARDESSTRGAIQVWILSRRTTKEKMSPESLWHWIMKAKKKQIKKSCHTLLFHSHLVVIHDCVEWLDPHRVDVSVQNDPLGSIVADISQFTHNVGEEACGEEFRY